MRYVLKDRYEVAHYWAHRVQARGRAGNLYYEDSTIYSYGGHFPIARHTELGAVLFTTRSYSPSTGQHCSIVLRAIPSGYEVIHCENVQANSRPEHIQNLHVMQELISEYNGKLARARKEYRKASYASSIVSLITDHNRYVELFDTGEKLAGVDDAVRLVSQYQVQLDAARAREVAELDARNAKALFAWVNGERDRAPHTSTCHLRIKDDEIQTSWGASIPVAHGLHLWHMLPKLKGKSFNGVEHSIALGVYKLDEVTEDGDIVAGCHRIQHSELARIATLLGL